MDATEVTSPKHSFLAVKTSHFYLAAADEGVEMMEEAFTRRKAVRL